ncbi:hypothetical protein GRI91_05610 [Altererythrobacter endophyticus]|uniref:SnoaL-like domain-containing protein n=2 Tax=Altericroceibacterium endophyticum TaxID=1808508 RepID=A0A6I4T1X2_9SPHN|nr:hypothetical protein [Altericroceibacterium endophyticum]
MASIATPSIAEESKQVNMTPPTLAKDQHALLTSDDPQLAANKQLVYDMYRTVLQAGQADKAKEFIREDYIQHNPTVVSGRAALEEYVSSTRPVREVKDTLELPLVTILAERDLVSVVFVRPEKDAEGNDYYSTWFDLFRIEDGKIAEHWDPMLRGEAPIDPNDKQID